MIVIKYLPLFLSLYLGLAFGHSVVFEEVGEIAGAISYIHVTFQLNLTGLEAQADKFTQTASDLRQRLKDYWSKLDHSHDAYNVPLKQASDQAVQDYKDMATEFTKIGKHYQRQIQDLRAKMPTISSSAFESTDVVRMKRFIGGLLQGIFGTFMGLYSRYELRQLKKELRHTILEQHRLIEVSNDHTAQLKHLEVEADFILSYLDLASFTRPTYALTKMLELERSIRTDLAAASAAIQQAQHRRLSVDFLKPERLHQVFNAVKAKAMHLQSHLLVEHPSDLFQLELSYLYDGSDVLLILHVPTAPKRSILRLLQFHPFPLAFSKTHSLLPRPEKRLLAISSEEPRLTMEVAESDLASCHRVNRVHLCERHGVMKRQMESTCLGSLYVQRFQAAMSLCEIDLVPHTETVLQLMDNWFLIYSPTAYTAYVTCLNHSSTEFHLKPGVNRLPLSPRCQLRLENHVIYADSALRLPSQIKEFQWDLNDVTFSDSEVAEAEAVLAEVSLEGANKPTLAAVRRATSHHKRAATWTIAFILIGLIVTIGLVLTIYIGIGSHKIWVMRKVLRSVINWLRRTNDVPDEEPAEVPPAPVVVAAPQPPALPPFPVML